MDIQCACNVTSSFPCNCSHNEVQDYQVMPALPEEDHPYESPILTPPRTTVPHKILLEHVKQNFAHLTNVQQEEVIAITKRRFEIWLKEQVAEHQDKPAEFGRKCLSVPAPTHKETYCVDFTKAMQTFLGNSEGGASPSPAKAEGDRKVKSLSGSTSPLLSVSTYGALRFSFDKFTLGMDSRDDDNPEPSPAIDYSDEEVFVEEIELGHEKFCAP